MQAAETQAAVRRQRRPYLRVAGMAVVLFALTAGFFWKLVLTNQYTWLEGSDLAYQVLPWFQYQAGEWRNGRFPMWDPYHWGGQSLIGQAQPGAAYPLNWALFSLPLRNGWIRQSYLHWYFVFIHFQAVLFCYWLARDLRLSRLASIAAGCVFAFGGYIGTITWPQMLNGAVWAPLVFLFLLRAGRGVRPVSSAALSGMFLGVSWLSGHHQVPIFVTVSSLILWLYFMFLGRSRPWRAAALPAVFLAFTLLTGALQILPAYEYGRSAKRWVGVDDPVGWGDPVPYLVHQQYNFGAPSILGTVIPGLHRHASPFVGSVALALAVLGLVAGWRERGVRIFAAVAAGGLLFSLGSDNVFHGLLYALVPALEKARTPAMAILVFSLGVSVLTAYGVESLFRADAAGAVRRTGFALLGFGAFGYGVLLTGSVFAAIRDERIALPALMAALAGAALAGLARGAVSPRTGAAAVLALVLIELGNLAFFPHRLDKERNVYLAKLAGNEDIVGFLRTRPRPFRIEIDQQEIPFNIGDWHGIDVFGGFMASLPAHVLDIDAFHPKTRALYGIGYSVARQPSRPDQELLFEGKSGLKVFRNPGAFPRAWSVHEAVKVGGAGEVRHVISLPHFDLRAKVPVTVDVPALEKCPAPDEVALLRRDANSVELAARMACTGMVVLSDGYAPGWTADIDGRPATVYPAYHALRGVVVGPGTHRIVMRYRPASVLWGAALSAFGALGAVILWLRDRKGFEPTLPHFGS